MNRTLLIIKPDAYEKNLEHSILERIKARGLSVVRAERRTLRRPEVEELYREHRGKPFFKVNTEFILSGPVGLFVLEGEGNVVGLTRDIVGSKVSERAEKGTIRGDFGIDPENIERNLVHASSSPKDAEREIALLGSRGCSVEGDHPSGK